MRRLLRHTIVEILWVLSPNAARLLGRHDFFRSLYRAAPRKEGTRGRMQCAGALWHSHFANFLYLVRQNFFAPPCIKLWVPDANSNPPNFHVTTHHLNIMKFLLYVSSQKKFSNLENFPFSRLVSEVAPKEALLQVFRFRLPL